MWKGAVLRTLSSIAMPKRLPFQNGAVLALRGRFLEHGTPVVRNFRVFQPYLSTDTIEHIGPFKPPKQMTFEEQRVMKAIRAWDRFPEDRKDLLNLDANFVNDLGLDSLDHVEIIMSLEDEFGFEIPDAEAEKLKTPRDIFKYICEHEDVFE